MSGCKGREGWEEDEPVSNSLVHELGGDRRVDSSTNGSDDLSLGANEITNALDLLADESVLGRRKRAKVSSIAEGVSDPPPNAP